MIDELLSILEEYGYPVYKQGAMSEDEEYPPTLITFWNVDTPSHAFYNNSEYGATCFYDINVYSDDPEVTYDLLENIRTALIERGWVVDGHGNDVPSDYETHTGRGFTAQYLLIKEA